MAALPDIGSQIWKQVVDGIAGTSPQTLAAVKTAVDNTAGGSTLAAIATAVSTTLLNGLRGTGDKTNSHVVTQVDAVGTTLTNAVASTTLAQLKTSIDALHTDITALTNAIKPPTLDEIADISSTNHTFAIAVRVLHFNASGTVVCRLSGMGADSTYVVIAGQEMEGYVTSITRSGTTLTTAGDIRGRG